MDRATIEDVFAPFGPVIVRRMFSGHGVYVDDACLAMVLRGTIWLKADAATKVRFLDAGCRPFAYETNTRATIIESFWSLPEAALDDEDVLRDWCALALDAARRTAAVKAAVKARRSERERPGKVPRSVQGRRKGRA